MKNQTAVEWLVNRWKKLQSEQEKMTWNQIIQMTELAKEMEKEQIRLIYEGILQNVGTSVKQADLPTFEQYYTQTFTETKKD